MGGFAQHVYDQDVQAQQDRRKFALAPLQMAINADQQRLSSMKEGTPEYEGALQNMALNIGRVRNVLGDKTPAEHPGRLAQTVDAIRSHLHLGGNNPQAAQDAKLAKFNAGNTQMAQEYATGALPFEQTPEGIKAAYERKTQEDVAGLRGTMREYVSPDGKERNWFRPGDEPAGWNASQGQSATKRQKANFVNPATKQNEEGSFDPSTGKYYNAAGEEVPGATPITKTTSNPYLDWKAQNPNGTVEQYEAMLGRTRAYSQGGPGSWTIAEGGDGQTVLYNSKTAQTRPVDNGLHKSGYYAKQVAPLESAKLNIQDYISNGVFDGPGDLSLQHAFFTATQPSTGFRMTKVQQDILQNSRSWRDSWQAKVLHATTGQWYTAEQRKQIADAALSAIANKEKVLGESTPSGPVHQKNQKAKKDSTDPLGVL